MKEFLILTTSSEGDYELLDSGEREKLERYGTVILSRPDPQALWPKRLPESEWSKRDGAFVRGKVDARWVFKSGVPEKWNIELGGLRFGYARARLSTPVYFPNRYRTGSG